MPSMVVIFASAIEINRKNAAPGRLSVHVNSAGAALRDPASELRTCKTEFVPQHPEKRRCAIDVHAYGTSVQFKAYHRALA